MKIRAVRVAEVGIFSSPVAIEHFSGGLDVLIGPNEQGKSTIFRAIDFVFQKRHTMTGKAVGALASREGGTPLIEADFEVDGRLWRITKRFGRGHSAELVDLAVHKPSARGADAEEMLARLVGSAGPNSAGRFGLLWVAQQGSLTPPEPDESEERPTLRAALRTEIDAVAGGELSRRVAARVSAELANYITAARRGPRKGSRYDLALQRRRELADARDACRRAIEQADERLERLAQLRGARDTRHSPEAMVTLRQALSDCQRLSEQAEKSQGERQRLEGLETAAGLAHERAKERLRDFVDARHEADRLEDERATIAAEVASLDPRIAAVREHLAALADEIDANEREHARLTAVADRQRELEQEEQALDLLRELRDKVAVLASEVSRRERELAALPVTQDQMRRLEDLERAARMAEIDAARPAAVHLDVALEAAGEGRVRIDGEIAKQRDTRAIAGAVTIDIAGIGQFRIVPTDAAEREALLRVAADAARARQNALERVGASSMEQARELAVRRDRLAEGLLTARAQLSALAPSGVAAIDAQIERAQQALAMVPADGDGEDAAVDGQLSPRLVAMAARINEQRAQRVTALLEQKELEHGRLRCDDRLGAISARLAALHGVLGPQPERGGAAQRLMELAEAARHEHDRLTRERMLHAETAPTAVEVRQRVEAREEAAATLQRAQHDERRLAEEIADLEGFVRAAGEAERGLELTRLDGEVAGLDREIAHYEHEIEALQLLAATLAEVEGENRARFLVPVTERIHPYLEQVFPDASVVFDEAFVAQQLTRGTSREALTTLSDGTREQVAILVRLGFGRLLAEAGMPTPLILDDALVYSDDERIVRMFAALETAAAHHQVIVFSCRSRSFEGLAGTRLAITPWHNSR